MSLYSPNRTKRYVIFYNLSQFIEEIEDIADRDERLRQQLDRKNKILTLISNNRNNLEKSLMNLDDYLNKSTSNNERFNNTARNFGNSEFQNSSPSFNKSKYNASN